MPHIETFLAAVPVWAAGREKEPNMTVGLRAVLNSPIAAIIRESTKPLFMEGRSK